MADFARGERLRELRQSKHLSQEEVAHELSVSVKTIRAWEQGKGIRWANAKRAGKFYEVDPETLVTREGAPDLMTALSPDGLGELREWLEAVEVRLSGIEDLLGAQASAPSKSRRRRHDVANGR